MSFKTSFWLHSFFFMSRLCCKVSTDDLLATNLLKTSLILVIHSRRLVELLNQIAYFSHFLVNITPSYFLLWSLVLWLGPPLILFGRGNHFKLRHLKFVQQLFDLNLLLETQVLHQFKPFLYWYTVLAYTLIRCYIRYIELLERLARIIIVLESLESLRRLV